MGWVLRVFQSRWGSPMLTVLKSLVIPLLEYWRQLWNPRKAWDIQAIEAIPRTFTYEITQVQHLKLVGKTAQTQINIYSFQRRNERYIIIHIWKITQHVVPNIDGTIGHKTKNRNNPSDGTLLWGANKHKPSRIYSIKCNHCAWASSVQLVA